MALTNHNSQLDILQANCLIARRVKHGSAYKRLADVKLTTKRYPVELRIGGPVGITEEVAHDRGALEGALISMLARSDVAGAIERLEATSVPE